MKTWDDLKNEGSAHYKTGQTEPIDLYRAGDLFHDFAVGNIIKYAYRSRKQEGIDRETLVKNMTKVIHYAELIIAEKEA